MSDDFLSRWSRRKRAVKEASDPEPPAQPEADAPTAAAAAEPPREAAEAEAEITPEELERLPKPEEVTLETDLTAFFRKGVPHALRNAVLRRAWTLDPAIRDFVSEAREYAYDWNTPGGVPGSGELGPADDAADLLRRVFGGGEQETADSAPRPADSLPSPPEKPREPARIADPGPSPPSEVPTARAEPTPQETARSVPDDAPQPRPRRHGGAVPS
jgi:hypothetical protein